MSTENKIEDLNRCRLVLTLNARLLTGAAADTRAGLGQVLAAGDVASVVFFADGLSEEAFQSAIEPLVEVSQQAGAAAVVVEDSRTAGRVGADGLQLGQDPDALKAALDKFSPKMMVAAGNVKTRHNALVLGESQPDYLMFGKPGGDIRPEPHPKNVDLGKWWSAMVEIPCIVLGGTDLESVVPVAQSGSEFVALGTAIFASNDDAIDWAVAAEGVRKANDLLDQHAPRFEEPED